MAAPRRAYLYLFQVLIAGVLHLPSAAGLQGWNREECQALIISGLRSGHLMGNDTKIFAWDPKSDDDIVLSSDGCHLCDRNEPVPYADSVPRLVQWLLPVLLLIVNMQFAPIGWRRVFSVMHLLGDPIDSFLSLVSKVEVWNRSLAVARKIHDAVELLKDGQDSRIGNGNDGKDDKKDSDDQETRDHQIKNIGVIVGAVEESICALDPDQSDEEIFEEFKIMLLPSKLTRHEARRLYRRTASDLVNTRTNELRRTWFSIGLYLFQVIAAFVPAIGDASSPSGGRIGMAVLFSYLLPTVLLSNAIGDYSSRSTRLRILLGFMEYMDPSGRDKFFRQLEPGTRISNFDSLAWGGADLSYRPEKRLFKSNTHQHGHKFLTCISLIPVILSCVTSAGVLWTKPTNFTCRHFLVIAVFGAWLFSAVFTSCITRIRPENGRRNWYIILCKDALISLTAMGLIIGSSCGLFNSCWCWGLSSGLVYLNPRTDFDFNNHVYYPAWVATCLGLQLGVFVVIRWVSGRSAFQMMSWSEEAKQAEVKCRLEASLPLPDAQAEKNV